MNAASDIAEFLASRRARMTPERAGLPSYGTRRVPGLRREEVASLAGVSADYYRRLERGRVSGVLELVLEALARALQLDDAERTHLFDLARAANPVARRTSRPPETRVRPVVHRLLDQIEAPAIVRVTLDGSTLDRIDAIVRPGVNLNPPTRATVSRSSSRALAGGTEHARRSAAALSS